jgi:hypothetical protein
MILYNVTVNVDDPVHDEWLGWMKETHIPDVMRTGMFIDHRFLKMLAEGDVGGQTYAIQYTCESMERFRRYESEFAPALREDVEKRFGGRFVAFRTLLEYV